MKAQTQEVLIQLLGAKKRPLPLRFSQTLTASSSFWPAAPSVSCVYGVYRTSNPHIKHISLSVLITDPALVNSQLGPDHSRCDADSC